MRTLEHFKHVKVEVRKAQQLDGAPADYWQQYSDDKPPYIFPLVSDWAYKNLPNPSPVMDTMRSHSIKLFMTALSAGFIAYSLDMPFIYLVGLVVYFIQCYRLVKLFIGEVGNPLRLRRMPLVSSSRSFAVKSKTMN